MSPLGQDDDIWKSEGVRNGCSTNQCCEPRGQRRVSLDIEAQQTLIKWVTSDLSTQAGHGIWGRVCEEGSDRAVMPRFEPWAFPEVSDASWGIEFRRRD